jgi:solute carrier family 25 aspartate/glutamate transporter 12/13
MDPKPGQLAYTGIRDTAQRIYKEEGFRAFWQGTRVVKPYQFGITLLLYEVLQRVFYVDFAGT